MATKATPTTASHSPWVTRRWTMTAARATTAASRTHFSAVAHGGGLVESWIGRGSVETSAWAMGTSGYCGQVVLGLKGSCELSGAGWPAAGGGRPALGPPGVSPC